MFVNVLPPLRSPGVRMFGLFMGLRLACDENCDKRLCDWPIEPIENKLLFVGETVCGRICCCRLSGYEPPKLVGGSDWGNDRLDNARCCRLAGPDDCAYKLLPNEDNCGVGDPIASLSCRNIDVNIITSKCCLNSTYIIVTRTLQTNVHISHNKVSNCPPFGLC